MSGLEVAGFVVGVVAGIDQLVQRFSALKKRIDEFSALPDMWSDMNASLGRCAEDLNTFRKLYDENNNLIDDATKSICQNSIQEIDQSFGRAEKIIENLRNEFLQKSSSSPAGSQSKTSSISARVRQLRITGRHRSATDRPVKNLKLFLGTDSVRKDLEEVVTISKEARSSIERMMGCVNCMLATPQARCDEYVEHFDEPWLPKGVVLEFDKYDDPERPLTVEADLKRALLSNSGELRVTAAVGRSVEGLHSVVGMGGVGKTVALKGLCSDKDVQQKYLDGVFFMSLGKDVTEKDVIESIAVAVDSCGGKFAAQEIQIMSSAEAAGRKASIWFKKKRVLFVCDDIWACARRPLGFFGTLKLLLSQAQASSMVISTRDRKISNCCNEVSFGPREVRGHVARRILEEYVGLPIKIDEVLGSDGLEGFNYILDTCAGLPVALGVAGTSLRAYVKNYGNDTDTAVRSYAKDLAENVTSVGEEDIQEYRAFQVVLETSIQHCESWAESDEGRIKLGCEVKVREKFEALSVLRKQTWMPLACLGRLWRTDSRASKQLLCKLSEQNVVIQSTRNTSKGLEDGLSLHDLVLEQSQRLAAKNLQSSAWHAGLLDEYIPNTAWDMSQADGWESREWWDSVKVPDDGYILSNVARHLAICNKQELKGLLSDVRWSMRRMTDGGIVSLRGDFQELYERFREAAVEAKWVEIALEESWMNISRSRHFIPFEMYGRLLSRVASSQFVNRFMSSVAAHAPKPHLIPKGDISWKADGRELSRFGFSQIISCLCWSEQRDLVAIGQENEIHLLNMNRKSKTCALLGHSDTVTCAAMGADEKRIVSGSRDKSVLVWDVDTTRCIAGPLLGHDDVVHCVAMSGDGKRVVSGSRDKTLRVWDVDSMQCITGPLIGHHSAVYCVAISGNGKQIVSGSRDETLRVWDVDSTQCIAELIGHDDAVYCVAMSEYGNRIVSGSWDKTLRVWDVDSMQCITGPLIGHDSAVNCVAISRDGEQIVSGSWDKTLRVWNVDNMQCTATAHIGHDDAINCLAISGDAEWIVSGSWDKTLRVWKVDSGQCTAGPLTGHDHAVYCVAMSWDGTLIVSGSWDKTLRVWDAGTARCIAGPLIGHDDAVWCVAMSKDGKRVVSGSRDKTLRAWDVSTAQCIAGPLIGHDDVVWSVAMSENGNRIVSGSRDKTLRIWDVDKEQCIAGPLVGHDDAVNCVAMSPDGNWIVSGSWDRTLRIWEGMTGKFIVATSTSHQNCSRIEFEDDCSVLITTRSEVFRMDLSSAGTIEKDCAGYVYSNEGGMFVTLPNSTAVNVAVTPSFIRRLCFTKEQSIVAAGLKDGQVLICEVVL